MPLNEFEVAWVHFPFRSAPLHRRDCLSRDRCPGQAKRLENALTKPGFEDIRESLWLRTRSLE